MLIINFEIDFNKAKSVINFLLIIKIKIYNVNLCFNAIHANPQTYQIVLLNFKIDIDKAKYVLKFLVTIS